MIGRSTVVACTVVHVVPLKWRSVPEWRSVSHTPVAPVACLIAKRLRNLGFSIVATRGTAHAIERARIPVTLIQKMNDGSPHVVDALSRNEIQLVINTTQGTQAIRDSYAIRRNALIANVPYFTTLSAALAVVDALEAQALLGGAPPRVRSLQEWHALSAGK